MRVPIIVPELGTAAESVRVNGWFVDQGDWVVVGDLVVELLIAGMTFDIASETTGRLVEISRNVDSETTSGALLGWVEAPTVDVDVSDP